MKRLLLLPGMEGTGELFGPFVSEVSSWATAQIVRYPPQECLTVEQLVDRIELDAPVTVIAESFSGAVGIRLAARHPALVLRLVLVSSFVTPPAGSGVLRLFGTLPYRLAPPRWAVRTWLAGPDASDDLVTQVRHSLSQVSPEVLACRLAAISRIDERATLRGLQVPVLTIAARQDRLVAARDTVELRSCAPGGQHFDLDGPHLVLQARPRESAALLRAHAA